MAMWKPDEEDEEYDLTPMIDIVFLLIAFFMVVAKLIDDTKIEVEMPQADKSIISPDKPKRQTLSLTEDGVLYWATEQMGKTEEVGKNLQQRIEPAMRLNPELQVYLRADARVPHHNVQDVMEALAAGGAYNLVFGAYSVE